MTDKLTLPIIIDNTFKSLTTQITDMSKITRGLQDELKSLHKMVKQSDKSSRTKQKRPQTKMHLSKDLEKFLALDKGTLLTKAEVMKSVSTYIKEKNLQIQEDKRKFLPNKELSKIFGIKKPQNMTFVEINKHVSPHLSQLSQTSK
jgi:chromatin remodeling complex protein RSC6